MRVVNIYWVEAVNMWNWSLGGGSWSVGVDIGWKKRMEIVTGGIRVEVVSGWR